MKIYAPNPLVLPTTHKVELSTKLVEKQTASL